MYLVDGICNEHQMAFQEYEYIFFICIVQRAGKWDYSKNVAAELSRPWGIK